VAGVLVATGIYLILAGGDQTLARGLLLAGIGYAIVFLVLDRRERS